MSKPKSTSSSSPLFNLDDYTSNGAGVIVLGTLVSQAFHTLTSKTDIFRYTAYFVSVKAAHTRTYNKYGSEVVPTDFLKDASTKITVDQLLKAVGDGLAAPKGLGLGNDLLSQLHPNVSNVFTFWMDSDQAKSLTFNNGEDLVIRTNGNSIFISKLTRADEGCFSGMENEKLLNQISSKTDIHGDGDNPLPGQDREGVDESEWD